MIRATSALSIGLVAVAVIPSARTAAQPNPADHAAIATASQIVGTWRLVRTEQLMADGTTRPDPDLGANPIGYQMYEATGRMCSVFDNGDRPRWSRTGASAEDLRAVVQNTVFYCGSYRVDADRSVIVIQVEIGQSPNGRGTTRERRFELVGDNLTLHPTPLPAGVTTWSVMLRRVRR
jgi:hypothetical protein